MGHDTTAYLGGIIPTDPQSAASSNERGEKIAHLRGHYDLYEVLDAEEYDGRVSGIGIGRWFTRDQLRTGLERLRLKEQALDSDDWTYQPAIAFLETCLDRLPSTRDWVYVDFG